MTPTSILIFRNGSIGNTLVAMPAISALRKCFPAARLSVVVDPVGRELLLHCPEIDELIVYDKRGADRGLQAHCRLVRKLRALRPTHAVLFKRFFRNGLLAFLSGARFRAGYRTDGQAPFLTHTIDYDESSHVIDQNLRLISLLGCTSEERRYRIPVSEQDRAEANRLLKDLVPANSGFTVAHYGGLTTAPDFLPVERFTDILRLTGTPVLLVGAGKAEAHLANEISSLLPSCIPIMNSGVRVMKELIDLATYFVGFNSGPAHIAAATDTPGIVLYRPDSGVEAEIRKWRPASPHLHPLVPPAAGNNPEWKSFMSDIVTTLSHCEA